MARILLTTCDACDFLVEQEIGLFEDMNDYVTNEAESSPPIIYEEGIYLCRNCHKKHGDDLKKAIENIENTRIKFLELAMKRNNMAMC